MTPASIRLHPLWAKLKPYVAVEWAEKRTKKRRGRFRLELRAAPKDIAAQALDVTCRCVDCGAPIHPLRTRKGPKNKRSETVGHGIYVAVACPLSSRIGCSRGSKARDEYSRIAAEVGP